MIKLISIDMDGTLLDSQGNLPEGNIASIRAAKEKGIHIILNTGKPIDAIINEYNALELDDPIVTMTGGLILEINGNQNWKVLKGNPIPTSIFEAIYSAIRNIQITTHFMNEGITYVHHTDHNDEYIRHFVDSMNQYACLEYTVVENSPLLDWGNLKMPTYKIMFFNDNTEEVTRAGLALKAAKIPGIIAEFSSPHTVDVRTVESGKKNSIEYLCSLYHINPAEVMALGDHESDLELIQWAGVGALMGNADSTLKKQVSLVAPNNEDCGVAAIINAYALK